MAEFTSDIQTFKSSSSFLEVDPNMEFLNQFTHLNPSLIDTPTSNFHSLMGFSIDNFITQQVPGFPNNLADNFPAIFDHDEKNVVLDSAPPENDLHRCKKRIAIHSSGRGKRLKNSDKAEEKPKAVVHVRARRGQATDSHSLAERVRRGKINERLKCLQDIVPGCHKTMGMAVMLDEIINYVQSLQNQVDFLSMKLSAASTFHDFNLDTNAMETLQRAKAYEAQLMQIVVRRGYEELSSTQLGPLDLSFGSYPPN